MIGALVALAGAAAVQQAADGRSNIQSSINSLSPTVSTLTANVATAESLLTTAQTTQTTQTNQFAKICPAIQTVGALTALATGTDGPTATPTVNSIITAFSSNTCP